MKEYKKLLDLQLRPTPPTIKSYYPNSIIILQLSNSIRVIYTKNGEVKKYDNIVKYCKDLELKEGFFDVFGNITNSATARTIISNYTEVEGVWLADKIDISR